MTGLSASSSLKPGTDRRSAFSLIEIIVVVGLMSFIILGLMQMFNQTQRAFKLGTTQVDVLESGRAVMDMMQRELSQMKPSRLSNSVNFYAQIPLPATGYAPLLQELPGIPVPSGSRLPSRTNILQEIFFLTEENQRWNGIGYFVSPRKEGVGTLYRYETNAPFGQDVSVHYRTFFDAVDKFQNNISTPRTNNMTRLMDGVVHLRVRAFDTNGLWITNSVPFKDPFNAVVRRPYFTSYSQPVPAVHETEVYLLYSNVVPATVDLELGILEDSAIAKIKSIYNPANLTAQADARRNYLTNQAARTHLFRIRVPIRNVDPTAYQ